MNNPVRLLIGLLATGLAAAAALAGPLDKAQVARDAKWVVHVDVQAGLGSTPGQFFAQRKDEEWLEDLRKVRQETGLDPLSDIRGITVYGVGGRPEDGVALISVSPAIDAAVEKLQAKESSFKKITEGKHTFYTWTEHDKPRFGQIRRGSNDSERIVVVAGDKARLFASIDVLEGSAQSLAQSLAKSADGMLARKPQAGSFFFAAATELGSAQAMPFDQAKGLVLDVGEAEGNVYADLAVIPRNPEEASDLAQMMQGAVATVRMLAKRDPKMSQLVDLTQGISFGSEGDRITAQIRISSERLLECLQSMNIEDDRAGEAEGVNNEPDAGTRDR